MDNEINNNDFSNWINSVMSEVSNSRNSALAHDKYNEVHFYNGAIKLLNTLIKINVPGTTVSMVYTFIDIERKRLYDLFHYKSHYAPNYWEWSGMYKVLSILDEYLSSLDEIMDSELNIEIQVQNIRINKLDEFNRMNKTNVKYAGRNRGQLWLEFGKNKV